MVARQLADDPFLSAIPALDNHLAIWPVPDKRLTIWVEPMVLNFSFYFLNGLKSVANTSAEATPLFF
jgi:hypothetical protein